MRIRDALQMTGRQVAAFYVLIVAGGVCLGYGLGGWFALAYFLLMAFLLGLLANEAHDA